MQKKFFLAFQRVDIESIKKNPTVHSNIDMMNNSTTLTELQPESSDNNYSICYSTPQEFSLDEFEIEFVIHGLLISCVGLFGLCGNMASIFIFSKPQMRNSINTILIALVSCDLLVILTSILMFSLTVFGNTGNNNYFLQQNIDKISCSATV